MSVITEASAVVFPPSCSLSELQSPLSGVSSDFESLGSDLSHGDELELCLDDSGYVSLTRLDESEGGNGKVKLETRGVSSHRLQGQLWASQSIFKHSIVAKLNEIGRKDLSEKLDHCHSEVTYAKCNDCGSVSKFLNRCDLFFCPECQPKLSRERVEAVEWWTKEIGQPKHVILTVRNTEALTKAHVQELKESFSRLRRMKFARNWIGGFYRLEVTNEDRGWHLHIHSLVDCKYIDSRLLSEAWNKATRGAGYIVKVKDCRNKSYLQEVTKYAVKGSELSEWTPLDIATFIDAFSGLKTFGVFGSLYGKRTEWREWIKSLKEQKAACSCGCNSVRFFSEHEWLLTEISSSPNLTPIPPPRIQHPEFSFVAPLDNFSLSKH